MTHGVGNIKKKHHNNCTPIFDKIFKHFLSFIPQSWNIVIFKNSTYTHTN